MGLPVLLELLRLLTALWRRGVQGRRWCIGYLSGVEEMLPVAGLRLCLRRQGGRDVWCCCCPHCTVRAHWVGAVLLVTAQAEVLAALAENLLEELDHTQQSVSIRETSCFAKAIG